MNRKKSLAAVLLLCTVFGFTACGSKEQTKNGVTTKKVDKQAATDISNVHLRDKKSLYDKDHTKVTTIPSEITMFELIASVTIDVSKVIPTKVMAKLRE